MITAASLKSRTVKDLAAMAKRRKVPGWHAMRKGELIKALVRHARGQANRREKTLAQKNASPKPTNGKSRKPSEKNGSARRKPTPPQARLRLDQIKTKLAESKDLSFRSMAEGNGCTKDRIVLMVRDPYWLHAYWELSRASIERAKAALGQHWHGARPTLRLTEVASEGGASSTRRVVRDVPIHGGVNNWYLDVHDPPKNFQVDIGYLAAGDRFFSIARSNQITTPAVGTGSSFDQNWKEVAKDFDRVYAMSGGYAEQDGNRELKDVLEQQLHRPMGDPMSLRFGLGAAGNANRRKAFDFQVETELIVHGVTEPNAHVTLRGEPVQIRSDGTFAVRFTLPDRRHVLPVVASSPDGVEQRTIVLAVDRNTKVMEPIYRDANE